MNDEQRRMNMASTGLVGTESAFLDAHFEACRPEYEAMIRSVGIQQNWRVLDAACGAGSFLPLVASLVGPTGSISAFDLAPETVSLVDQRITASQFELPVDVRVASLLDVPFEDEEFDAVWCANSLIYLNDTELNRALTEFMRVLKPGGILSMKNPEGGLFMFSPGDPMLMARAWAAASEGSQMFRACLRSRTMKRWLEKAGLNDVWQRGTLSEIWAPLEPLQRQYIAGQLSQVGALAEQAELPASDLTFWRAQRNSDSADALVNHPELFWCEGHFVTVGRRP